MLKRLALLSLLCALSACGLQYPGPPFPGGSGHLYALASSMACDMGSRVDRRGYPLSEEWRLRDEFTLDKLYSEAKR